MKPAIVIDARYRISLPVIRSLGKRKIPVIATERKDIPKKRALGFFSRFCSGSAFISDPEAAPNAFVSDLRSVAEKSGKKPVLMPVGISSVLALSRAKDAVSEFAHIAVSDIANLELANDKSRLIPFADSVGIPVPKTTFRADGESLADLSERIAYPAVIKLPLGELLGLNPNERYAIIKSKEEFREKYPAFEKHGGEVLIQQYISGDGYGVSAVFGKDRKPIEVFCHRRLREYPASGGPSCFCESVYVPELVEYATKLLSALSWEGVAMVEFKGSPENGFYLMEINPRFWGSFALAPNSGCDIAHALYRAALGESGEPSGSPSYKTGHKMRFILQDVLSFPAYLKRAEKPLAFALSFLAGLFDPRISDGVLTLSDIPSSLAYLREALKKKEKIIRKD